MRTTPLPTRVLLPPRPEALPALPGHTADECRRLDGWQATVPVLGWLFHTTPNSDQGLLIELNRNRLELRALSMLDVLAILSQAGGGSPELCARVRTLTNSETK